MAAKLMRILARVVMMGVVALAGAPAQWPRSPRL